MARKAAVIDPLSVSMWRSLGFLLFASGQDSEARLAWQHALELNPEARWPNYFIGYLDLKEGKIESALAHFRASDEVFTIDRDRDGRIHPGVTRQESEQALGALKTKYAAGVGLSDRHGLRLAR